MTKEVLLSVRISKRLNGKLDRLAKLTSRTKSWLVDSLIAEAIDHEIEYAEAIQEGLESARRGEFIECSDSH